MALVLLALCAHAGARGVAVTNVIWSAAGTVPDGRDIRLDLSWEDSWRTSAAPANWDAVWLFAKFRTGADGLWRHARLSPEGRHYAVAGANGVPAAFSPAADGAGVFVFRQEAGRGPIAWNGVSLRWQTGKAAALPEAGLEVRVFALEMVYIPEGPFYLGDGVSPGRFHAGGDPTKPILITATPPRLQNTAGGLWAERTVSKVSSRSEGAVPWDRGSGVLPAAFPTGFRAVYMQKYEVTQGQYAAFLNTLTPRQAEGRFPSRDDLRPRSSSTRSRSAAAATATPYRYAIRVDGAARYSAAAPENACNYLNWDDGTAFADWAGLRPMTEGEFEKACRGSGQKPVPGEYAWGTTRCLTLSDFQGIDGSGTETALPSDANTLCAKGILGPVRVGMHERKPTRELAGASYYGILDLSGNVMEQAVSLGHSEGRRFTGAHGDGELTAEGEADVPLWPRVTPKSAVAKTSREAARGGAGVRGGDWLADAALLRASDRSGATTGTLRRHPACGFRAVRSAEAPQRRP